MKKLLKLAFFALILTFSTTGLVHAATTSKKTVKAAAVVKKAITKKAVGKKSVAKKSVVKKAVVKKKAVKKSVTCVRCRSSAEGADHSKAAKATSWKGLVIGMNEGEKSLVITEAPKLDHIKAYAQRSVRIIDDTKILNKDGGDSSFDKLDIGYQVVVYGSYDAKKRIISASSVEVVRQ